MMAVNFLNKQSSSFSCSKNVINSKNSLSTRNSSSCKSNKMPSNGKLRTSSNSCSLAKQKLKSYASN